MLVNMFKRWEWEREKIGKQNEPGSEMKCFSRQGMLLKRGEKKEKKSKAWIEAKQKKT